MDKIEARKALNRLQIVYKRLQAKYKNDMPMCFYKDDDVYKMGEDASNLFLYCQMAKDLQVMKECCLLPRYICAQILAREIQRGSKHNEAFVLSMRKASDYLRETETLYICTCWGLMENEANNYFIDKEDGQCKSKVTREVLEIPTYTNVHERIERVYYYDGERLKDIDVRNTLEIEAEAQSLSLVEKLAFVPVGYLEQAKGTFQRLLADGWITETQNGFVWKEGTSKSLICFFADLANDKWKLRESRGYGKSNWKDFAELFGMQSKTFINWKSDQRNHTGTQDPKGGETIRGYFD